MWAEQYSVPLPAWGARPSFLAVKPEAQHYFDGDGGELRTKDQRASPLPGGCAPSFARAFEDHSTRPCLGRRPHPDAPFEWTTYGCFGTDARAAAATLVGALPAGAAVGICGCSSYEWVVMDFACMFAGMSSVALSEVWDPLTLKSVARQREVDAMVCDAGSFAKVLGTAREIGVKLVILMQSDALRARSAEATSLEQCKVVSFDQVLSTPGLSDPVQRDPEATHTIIHTSGTTGLPKGVVYSDRLWLRNMTYLPAELSVGVSYQPLAFITDRHTIATSLWNGGRVGLVRYHPGRSKMESILADIKDLRPTFLKAVPKFLEQLQVAARMEQDYRLGILGGRVRTIICGAGAVTEAVMDFYRSCLLYTGGAADVGVNFIMGYGSTEVGNLAVNRKMLPHVHWKLVEQSGFGTDRGEGQLAVKTGEMMFSGYDRNAEKTREAFDADGFYLMGDIVRITWPAGAPAGWSPAEPWVGGDVLVDVLGRAGSSIKTCSGKWIAVEGLEDMYRSAPGVRYVMVYGDMRHDRVVAVVDPERDPERYDSDPDQLLAGLRAHAEGRGHPAHEVVARVVVAASHFGQGDQTLNGTDKLNRKAIFKLYRHEIEAAMDSVSTEEADPLRHFDPDKSFKVQGGTSIKANEIVNLYGKLGISRNAVIGMLMPPEGGHQPSIQRLKSLLIESAPEESMLPADISPELALGSARGEAVFLTGGTGFIGAFVLAELLSLGARVFCLVQAPNPEAARHRIESGMFSMGLWQDGVPEAADMNLVCVCGTLGAGRLGLSDADFDALAAQVGYILHLGAKVSLRADFNAHRSANVGGTIEVLRLAFRATARVLFASTTDVLPRGCGDEEPQPDELVLPKEESSGEPVGYVLSKIVGERLVAEAQRRSLGAAICRLGFIGGDSRSGACNVQDFLCRLLVGFAHTRAFPAPSGAQPQTFVRFLPVNVAARALAQVLLSSSFAGPFHISAGAADLPLMDLYKILSRFGSPFANLPVVSFADWIGRAEIDGAVSVWPVLSFAKRLEHFPAFNSRSARPATILHAVDSSTAASMTSTPEEIEATLHHMLRYIFHSRGQGAV